MSRERGGGVGRRGGRGATTIAAQREAIDAAVVRVFDEGAGLRPARACAPEVLEHADTLLVARPGYAGTDDCRRRLLLELLGGEHPERCGACDSCDAGTARDVEDEGCATLGARLVDEYHLIESA